jgi:hypothetical protein
VRAWRSRKDRRPVVFMHIGAMKTGTSFLQRLLAVNKQNLAEGGYLFPGDSWSDQAQATRDLMGILGQGDVLGPEVEGMWDRLSTEMVTYGGTASLFSHEFLSFADRRAAQKAVRSLTSRGADVHAILVVRDAIGVLPAQWQTDCRSGGVVSWPEFALSARSLLEEGPREAGRSGARVFQRTQGVPRMLEAWGHALEPGRLHVVTVPPSGSDPMLLWERFAEVVGMDPGLCSEPVRPSNTSLGQASAELMRRMNICLGPLPITEYRPTMKRYLATRVLAKRAKLEARARLDEPTLQFAAEWNRRVRGAIESSDAHLVGRLDDLPVEVAPELLANAAAKLDDPDEDEILAAASAAWAGLHTLVDRRVEKLRGLPGRPVDLDPIDVAPWQPTTPERWSAGPDPVSAAAAELADVARRAIDLQRTLDGRNRAER